MNHPSRHQRRRGLSLVELTVSMAVSTILLAGIASAMVIASHALPDSNSTMSTTIDAYRVADQLAGELYVAQTITSKTSKSITFFVPDRNGDANPEAISYSWSGIAGAPLVRQYHNGTQLIVADNVQEFQLTYTNDMEMLQPPPNDTESAEFVLSFNDGGGGGAVDRAVKDNIWYGQYFIPVLPANALSWSVTRVQIMARSKGPQDGVAAVQIRPATASNLPSVTVLEQQLMPENLLNTAYQWETFIFTSVIGLSPTRGMCLVIARDVNNKHICELQETNFATGGALATTDAGTSWTNSGGNGLTHYIHGTVTTRTTPVSVLHVYTKSIAIRLRIGADAATVVQTAVPLLNEPEVTG